MVEAVVLVGGQGTRLRPLTLSTPKPLLPVAGVPFLEHQFARARDAGVDRIVLATSYRSELFSDVFGDGSRLGLELVYVHEDEPLGTGGAIRNVAAALRSAPGDPVVILNGDVLSGHDLAAQVAAHRAADADVTLHLVEVDDARRFGCVPTDDAGRVTAFLEKMDHPVTNQVNAGCYVFARRVVDTIPTGRPVSVERETFPGLLAAGASVVGYVETAYWLDLGTPAAFVRGSCDLVLGRIASSALPGQVGERLVLAGADVRGQANGGTVVGPGAVVEQGAVVTGSVLLDGAVVRSHARVVESVVGVGAEVGAGTTVTRAVIGDRARVGERNELVDLRVWNDGTVGDDAVRGAG